MIPSCLTDFCWTVEVASGDMRSAKYTELSAGCSSSDTLAEAPDHLDIFIRKMIDVLNDRRRMIIALLA